jgi:hypothetical protein
MSGLLHPALADDQAEQTFRLMRDVAQMVLAGYSPDVLNLSRRPAQLGPIQTTGGLAIGGRDGLTDMWTPWGSWTFAEAGVMSYRQTPAILTNLGLKPRPAVTPDVVQMYDLSALPGVSLPPVQLAAPTQAMRPGAALAAWDHLAALVAA